MIDEHTKKPHLRPVPDAPADEGETDQVEQGVGVDLENFARLILAGLAWPHALCPHVPVEHLPRMAVILATEQNNLNGEVLPKIVDPGDMADTLTMEFKNMRTGAILGMTAPLRPQPTMNMEELVRFAMLIALADSPNARALLRMQGLGYKFLFGERSPLVTL